MMLFFILQLGVTVRLVTLCHSIRFFYGFLLSFFFFFLLSILSVFKSKLVLE